MATGTTVWNNLCDSNVSTVKIFENGDFNICFEKFIFSSLPHLLLAVISSYHFARHQHLRTRGLIVRYLTLHVRLAICLLIILSALFLFAIKFAYNRKFPPHVYVIWGLVYVFSWSMHSCYLWRLHRLDTFSLRGNASVILAVFVVFAFHLVLLRSAILSQSNSLEALLDFEEIFIYFTTAFHITYFMTLVKGQRQNLISGLLTSPPSTERLLTLSSDQANNSTSRSPEDSSNVLSKLFFCWINSLMKNGYKRNINSVEDLYELPNDLQTAKVLDTFYQHCNSRVNKIPISPASPSSPSLAFVHPGSHSINAPFEGLEGSDQITDDGQESGDVPPQEKKQKSLICLLLTTFKWEYFPLGVLKLFSDVCSFCNPIFLNLLVLYISSPKGDAEESSLEGYLYCFALFSATLLGSLASTQFEYKTSRVSLKFRSVIIDCIYKKTLSASQVDLRNEFTSGEIINLMSTDVDRVVGFCPSFHLFWSLPIQICVVLYLLYTQVGLAFLSGVAIAILLIPINRWIAIKIGQLSKTMMSQKDARVKLINETLQGIRTVKFHAWENIFIRKVEDIRLRELSSLKKRKYLDALCVFFWATTPIAISTLTFTTFVLMGNTLTAAKVIVLFILTFVGSKVFTSISLFAILITPLNAFPWVVNGLMEAWVSIKRIQRLLNLDDLEPTKHYDFFMYYLGFLPSMSGEVMLKMKDTSFTWCRDASKASLHNVHNDDERLIDISGCSENVKAGDGIKINLYKLNLEIKEGMFVGVVGSVGSGKSSLLLAILGEMKKVSSPHSSNLSLGFPLEDGFGYFSQEPWIQRGTLKWNILFGKKFAPHKYSRVVSACALDSDIAILPNGDETEIGESGVTLSGGQKARVSLARTVYQEKGFYLLDDPYASVDAQVASRIHSDCIMGLLRSTTRIVVTHHVRFLKDADFIVVMKNGRVARSGPPSHLNLETYCQEKTTREQQDDDDDDDDKLILTENAWLSTSGTFDTKMQVQDGDDDDELINANGSQQTATHSINWNGEERQESGMVKWRIYLIYWGAIGSCLSFFILLSLFLMQASRNACDWWLSYWVIHYVNQSQFKQEMLSWTSKDTFSLPFFQNGRMSAATLMNDIYRQSLAVRLPSSLSILNISNSLENNDLDVSFYLIIYGSLAGFNSLATIFRAVLFAYGGIEAARKMHCKLIDSIFKASIKFFDVTSLGGIMNRFSSDVFSIDDALPFVLNIFLAQSFGLLGSIVMCCYGLPFSLIAIFLLSIIYYYIQRYYRLTSRELKRISCVTLSPIYGHFSETLSGLSIIRAHRASDRFEKEALVRLDSNQRAQFACSSIIQWLNVRFQLIGVALITCVSLISVLQKEFGTVSPGLVGLAISYVLSITGLLGGLVLSFTETEKMLISVERLDDYINNIPHEDAFLSLPENIPALWPFVGVVTFNNVTMRYGVNLPDVLRGVTFETSKGERVGVVGRTGSGKSSLFLALMRMVPLRSGKIYIDGVDVQCLLLREFRSRISMIPQDPFLFSGTVRENLDPSGKYSEREITKCLSRCGMLEVVEQIGGLDACVEERGQQFSAGQKQLICLTRTLLTESHVVCIDEATASVDVHTDQMIQATIKEHFRGRTVITIAHRMETILDYNRIMVMSHGRLLEFDTPSKLLDNPNSAFSSLLKAKGRLKPLTR